MYITIYNLFEVISLFYTFFIKCPQVEVVVLYDLFEVMYYGQLELRLLNLR